MPYAWAAYKKGRLASMGPLFADTSMAAAEFKEAFEADLVANYHSGWTLFAQTALGYRPIGFILAFYSHPNHAIAPFMVIGDMIWAPWASSRNIIEGVVHFFARMRDEVSFVDYARGEDKKRFFEVLMKHGLVHRVGTTFVVHAGEPVAVYETRRSK